MNIPLLSEQEQDEANALKWWRETSEIDKLLVRDQIASMGGFLMANDVRRFAQLGFTHIALLAERSKR